VHQLGQLEKTKPEFDKRDARVFIVTTYDAKTVRGWIKKKGYKHRFLTSAKVLVEALGLTNNGHPDAISEPATFVLAPDGRVLLADRTTKAKREPMAAILAAIDADRAASGK
jgi:peroxiredoxin